MSNIVALRRQTAASGLSNASDLIYLFAHRRRGQHDAFWLKENAELLQILAALGGATDLDLTPLIPRAQGLLSELRFFPQYYRMYLSLALDLRDLGLKGVPVDAMADFVKANAFYDIELSDCHRSEARLLLARAGHGLAIDPGLDERLASFCENAALFCLPNRCAAYDLTHIVFHMTRYGRVAVPANAARRASLLHAGVVAWLEGNLDLLAEVVLALRFCNDTFPDIWLRALEQGADASFAPGAAGCSLDDDYHQYLVVNWAVTKAGGTGFCGAVPPTARFIRQQPRQQPALQEVSLALLNAGDTRVNDWSVMRWRLWSKLSEPTRARLMAVETMPEFEGFFAGFSRADRARGAA